MKPMKYEDYIRFEIMVGDFADYFKVDTQADLEWFCATLHEHLERAIQDYALDNEIVDYEPQY